jgi:hypothetical protein
LITKPSDLLPAKRDSHHNTNTNHPDDGPPGKTVKRPSIHKTSSLIDFLIDEN